MSEQQQENPEVDEALESVKEALSPKKFNIVDAIQGKAYPTDEIVVYLDEVNIRKLRDLNKELTRLNNAAATDTERYMELEKEALETADKVRESGLRFYLTGVGQAVINEAVEQTKDDGHAFNMYILAKSVIKVENHEGAIDDRKWTPEDAEKFYQALSPEEYARLQEAIMGLSFASGLFDEAVDAGFLHRR